MRIIATLLAVCAFAQAAYAQEMHLFSRATTSPCAIEEIFEDVETKIVSSVRLICIDGPTTYSKTRSIDDAAKSLANWPTRAWNSAKKGDAATCALRHVPFGKDFFIVEHSFENCVLDTPKVTVEAQ